MLGHSNFVTVYRWPDCFQQQVHSLCQRHLPIWTNNGRANRLDDQAYYLDLTFIIGDSNRLYTKLYDKCDNFNFHIVKFPFLSNNIRSGPSYGVYILHLIRYARCCIYYGDSGYNHKLLVDRFLSQSYKFNGLRNSFLKFHGRYPDLIEKYQRSFRDILNDCSLINTVHLCCQGFVDIQDLS